jgi:hypothetical protein
MTDHATIRPAGTKNYIKFRSGAVAEYMKRSAPRLGEAVFQKPMRPGGGNNPYSKTSVKQ